MFGARPAAPAAEHRRPDDRHRRDRGRQHARAVRLLPAGRADRCRFLGAAQIDRFGNINTTVIGPYDHPTTRLPGRGGACEIAINARQVFVIMRQSEAQSSSRRSTSGRRPATWAAPSEAERIRREGGWLGRGPSVVVTDLGIYHFDDDGEMRLDSLHPGATLEEVRDTIGWDVAARRRPGRRRRRRRSTSSASIREELDPGGVYTK